ncbi:MAG: CotH kinase family protein [Verrucomicrobia bacterium]|nr:CotH kinase family protein [Verrucomicrobiota bacterium]
MNVHASTQATGARATAGHGFSLDLRRLLAALVIGATPLPASPVISEFMASNKTTLVDEDGDYSDWIEIHNPDSTAVSLAGWYLTDNAKKRTKWAFPAVSVPADGYLIVFASSKDRRTSGGNLHTNFSLDADGEYLGLIKPDGTSAASEYAATFPPQVADISYGITQPAKESEGGATGYLRTATPGSANPDNRGLILAQRVTFSPTAGLFTGTTTVTLSGAAADQKIRYVIAAPSAQLGADLPDPTASSELYTGPILVPSPAVIRAAVFSGDDSRSGLAASAQYLQVANNGSNQVYWFESNLPILVLDDHGLGPLAKDEIDHSAWLYAWTPGADGASHLLHAPDLATSMTMTVHGFSSADFPKKSFKLDLTTDLGWSNPQPLLGLPAADSWILIGPWSYDRSFLRNAYVYALSNQLGRWAPRTQFAEVFLNNGPDGLDQADYAGVYVLTDKITVAPQRINLATLAASDTTEPALTGGYILRIDPPQDDKYSWRTSHGFPDYATCVVMVEEPKLDKLPAVQRDYIRGYVQKFENALQADAAVNWATRTYLDYLDRPSWIDHHLLNVLAKNIDAFRRSTYFTKDRGGKLVAGPVWDYDRSLGSYDGRDADWSGWNGAYDAVDVWNFGWWGLLARDPDFRQAWVDRWQSLRRHELSDANLTELADALAARVGTIAAERDASHWEGDRSAYGDYQGEVAHLKDWVTRRAAWIDTQFLAPPTIVDDGANLLVTPADGTRLAYTLDGTDPRLGGGALSGTALVATGPITLPRTANLYARSHAATAPAFPGSPWSSLSAGPVAAPLSAALQSRLVNLSVRSTVRGGENVLIAAVVVRDSDGKAFLARAVGPSLVDFGVTQPLADPLLRVVSQSGSELGRNFGWTTCADAAKLPELATQVGAFPLSGTKADSALATCLAAGQYSMLVSSATTQTGAALAELYETASAGRAVNFSARGLAGTGEGALIGGFVVGGNQPKRVLIRGIGPALRSYGVSQALADPVLTLYHDQVAIAANDDWGLNDNAGAIAGTARAIGAFALTDASADAALLLALPPGVYSVVVSAKGTAEGVALVEIYDAD